MPVGVVLQHLSQELHDFLGSDAPGEQLKYKSSLAAQGGHRCYATPFTGDSRFRCLRPECPRLAQKRGQRNVRLVLKVQNRPEFPYRCANSRRFALEPLLSSVLADFEVSPLRLLVGEARVPQSSPHRILRNRHSILLSYHLPQATHRPQISLKPKVRSRLQNDVVKGLHIERSQQPWTPTPTAPLQSTFSLRGEAAYPTKKCSTIHTVRFRNLTHRLPALNRQHGRRPNVERRVPSLAHAQVRSDSAILGQGHMLQFLCGEPYLTIMHDRDTPALLL